MQVDWAYGFKLTMTKVMATSTKKGSSPYSNQKKYLTSHTEKLLELGSKLWKLAFYLSQSGLIK